VNSEELVPAAENSFNSLILMGVADKAQPYGRYWGTGA
tara:strand:+ start:3511 stop:3624 length:114 start_codon:yes stop_codon:yes gene_type:complete